MAYDEKLGGKIDAAVSRWKGMEMRRMFGGLCYLLGGNMAFGVWKDQLIVRTSAEAAAKHLAAGLARPFDVTGRPMKGWVMVGPAQWQEKDKLRDWLREGKSFAAALPPKGR